MLLLAKNDTAGARQAFEKTLQLNADSNEALVGLVIAAAVAIVSAVPVSDVSPKFVA